MNNLTIGVKIYVEDTDKTFHTLDDWDLALGNNNYIGDPEMETTYIKIPGRDGLIDASEAVTGRRIYTKRSLSFELGGTRDRLNWDGVISHMRNEINGRICQLTLDNDRSYYWRGRVYLTDFDRFRDLGTFTLEVPDADPYKYDVLSSSEPWLWDPFNFETGVIIQTGSIIVDGTETVTIPAGHMLTCPSFVVTNRTSSSFLVQYKTIMGIIAQATLRDGSNTIPELLINGDDPAELTFMGSATVQIVYRGGSL